MRFVYTARWFVTVSVLLLNSFPVHARALPGLYDNETLAYWQQRYGKSTTRIFKEGILPALNENERAELKTVEIEFPIRSKTLFGFYASAEAKRIVMPVQALKLLDDLSIAWAWLWRNGYRFEAIEDYVAMLKYKPASAFAGGDYAPPLQALGVPEDALQDRKIDELSLRFFNSARAFVLAHELAHVLYGHESSSVENELAADQFALEILARTGTIPMGMVLFFQASAQWFPNRADFKTETLWRDYLENKATHPLNAKRVKLITGELLARRNDFSHNEKDRRAGLEIVTFISTSLTKLVSYLNDDELLRCVAKKVYLAEPSVLLPRPTDSPPAFVCNAANQGKLNSNDTKIKKYSLPKKPGFGSGLLPGDVGTLPPPPN